MTVVGTFSHPHSEQNCLGQYLRSCSEMERSSRNFPFALDSLLLCLQTRGGAVGWRTALYVGRSWVRYTMMSPELLLTQSFWPHYGPGIDSASNRNYYQEYFLGHKSGRCVGLTTLPSLCVDCLGNVGTSWNPQGLYKGFFTFYYCVRIVYFPALFQHLTFFLCLPFSYSDTSPSSFTSYTHIITSNNTTRLKMAATTA